MSDDNDTIAVETKFIFTGHFNVRAESIDEAKRMINEDCGLVLGGPIHTMLNDDDVNWDFDTHPETSFPEKSSGNPGVTLLDIISCANAITVNGLFIRYFHFENGDTLEDDGPDPILVSAYITDDSYQKHEFMYTRNELESAVYNEDTKTWLLTTIGKNPEVHYITAHKVENI